jgi:hypothetical protein
MDRIYPNRRNSQRRSYESRCRKSALGACALVAAPNSWPRWQLRCHGPRRVCGVCNRLGSHAGDEALGSTRVAFRIWAGGMASMGDSHGVQSTGRPTADLHPSRPNGADHRAGWADQFAEREGALLLRHSAGQRLGHLCQRRALGTAERRRHQPLRLSRFSYQSDDRDRKGRHPTTHVGSHPWAIDQRRHA